MRPTASALLFCAACALARPAAAGVAFSIDDATLAPGVGEQVIGLIAPQLAQRGLGPALEQELDTAIGASLQQLETNINGRLGMLDLSAFLRAMSNAAAASANVLPLDHAGEPSFITLGAAAGGALNMRGALNTTAITRGLVSGTLPEIGIGGALALSLGLRLELLHLPPLGAIDFDRLSLEITAMAGDLAQAANGLHSGLLSGLSAPYLHLGLHGQYQAVRGVSLLRGGLLRWGGLQVGSGLHFSHLAVTFAGALPGGTFSQPFTWQDASATLQASWKGSATVRADTHTLSLPLLASTSLQLLYLLTVYGGVGADLNLGANLLALDGSEPARVNIVTPAGQSLELAAPQARLDARATASASLADLRGFAGAQLNLWALALYAQASADTARSIAVAAGARLFW